MNSRCVWRVFSVVAVFILVAAMVFVPTAGAASPPAKGKPPSGGNTGICVAGQVIDKAHKGIAGLKVVGEVGGEIDSQAGVAAQTDDDGYFKIGDLTPGEWVFRVEVPDSWKVVTPAEVPLTLAYGYDGCYRIRFKLEPLGCVIVKKFNEEGKPLEDWVVHVSGPIDPKAVTDENGEARFTELVPGTYVVSEEVPYPWQALTPTQATVQVHPAWDDNDCATVEFQNERLPTSCVTGYKIDDQHNPLAGWKVYAAPADGGGPTFTTVSAEDGSFTFPELTLGTWTIWEEVQDWWAPVTPAKFNVTLDQASEPPECVEVRFKNRPPDLCAEGYKVDENGKGLEGWTVVAFSEADPAMQLTTTTDAHGHYRFNGLTLGNWIFDVQHEVGWTSITGDEVKVPVTGGKYCTQVPIFRNQSPLGCVEGYKRDDVEVGLPGWNISLKPVGGKNFVHVWTDGTGYFRFDNLPVGEYEVWEEMQPGWAPQTPTKYVVEIEPKDEYVCERVEFVNKQVERDICIDGFKLDKNGDVGLPGWLVTAKNLASGEVTEAATDGLGYFRFGGLTPGKYEVAVTEQEGWVPVGPTKQIVAVDWPPKLTCVTVKFFDKQKGAPPPKPEPPPPDHKGCRDWYRIKAGDTLAKIAASYHTSVHALAKANRIPNPDRIYMGAKLCIP